MYGMTRPMRSLRMLFAFLILLIQISPAAAGLVTRPTKTCGTTSYVAEVAAGCTTIKSSEVDADINAVITGGVNNIETANINAAGLGTAALATGSVTTAKLATGSTVNATATGAVPALLGITTVETTISSMSITTRGGRVVVTCSWGVSVQLAAASAGTSTLKYKVDGSTIVTTDNPVLNGNAFTATFPCATPTYTSVPAAGAHTILITGVNVGAGIQFITGAANPGSCTVIELS